MTLQFKDMWSKRHLEENSQSGDTVLKSCHMRGTSHGDAVPRSQRLTTSSFCHPHWVHSRCRINVCYLNEQTNACKHAEKNTQGWQDWKSSNICRSVYWGYKLFCLASKEEPGQKCGSHRKINLNSIERRRCTIRGFRGWRVCWGSSPWKGSSQMRVQSCWPWRKQRPDTQEAQRQTHRTHPEPALDVTTWTCRWPVWLQAPVFIKAPETEVCGSLVSVLPGRWRRAWNEMVMVRQEQSFQDPALSGADTQCFSVPWRVGQGTSWRYGDGLPCSWQGGPPGRANTFIPLNNEITCSQVVSSHGL